MPKTNHDRCYVDKRDYTVTPGDHTRGKHGAAQKKRGLKKYIISRLRFKQKALAKVLLKDPGAQTHDYHNPNVTAHIHKSQV